MILKINCCKERYYPLLNDILTIDRFIICYFLLFSYLVLLFIFIIFANKKKICGLYICGRVIPCKND
jgi:hypothetical protein